MPKEILLVDDDPLLRRSLAFTLERAGYRAQTAGTATEALSMARAFPPDLLLLDIGLPGMDGLEALRIFRREFSAPVLLLTARRGEEDEVRGLGLGADDYIKKPYNTDVLLARIAAALRRRDKSPLDGAPRSLTAGNICIDPLSRTVQVGNEYLDITPRTFEVLYMLAAHAGEVVPLNTLLTQIWGPAYQGEPQVLYVHIRWLREKLQSIPGSGVKIITIHRIGYKLVEENA